MKPTRTSVFSLFVYEKKNQLHYSDHSYITSVSVFLGFVTPPPCVGIVLVLKIGKNYNFLTASLLYKCLRNI